MTVTLTTKGYNEGPKTYRLVVDGWRLDIGGYGENAAAELVTFYRVEESTHPEYGVRKNHVNVASFDIRDVRSIIADGVEEGDEGGADQV